MQTNRPRAHNACLQEFFSAGTAVVRQGDRGDKFYIIRGGTVVVTKREGEEGEVRVGTLRRGDYFGEQALLHKDRRLATVTAQPPGVECLTLERGYVVSLSYTSINASACLQTHLITG